MASSTLTSRPHTQTASRPASSPDPQADSVSLLTLSPNLIPVQRLIVLVPEGEMDEVELARRVWELASAPHLRVLFLALCDDVTNEPRLHRRLATLTALTRDARIAIETRFERGRNWIRPIRSVVREGDVTLCLAGHVSGWRHEALSLQLEKFGIPTWILKGFEMTPSALRRKPLQEFLFWPVSLVIVLLFLVLQARIMGITETWAQNALLALSVPGELGVLWLWHFISA